MNDKTMCLRVPRYDGNQQWFKGNTHIHSTASDGGWTFDQLEEAYASAGYDFLFRTDHWVASQAQRACAPTKGSLLWLDGVELDGFDEMGSYYHVVCLGTFEGIERAMGFPKALAAVREQGGILILAHPFWTGNTFDEANRWAFDGVELYNHVCQWLRATPVLIGTRCSPTLQGLWALPRMMLIPLLPTQAGTVVGQSPGRHARARDHHGQPSCGTVLQ